MDSKPESLGTLHLCRLIDTIPSEAEPASERFLLGMIAGICALEPRDDAILGVLVEQLQKTRQRGDTRPA